MNVIYQLNKEDLEEVIKNAMKGRTTIPLKKEETDALLTTDEACQRLRCSKPTLHRWKKAGIIPFLRIGSNIRYRESDIKKLIDSKKK